MKQHIKKATLHTLSYALCAATLWCGTGCSTAYAQQSDAPGSPDAPVIAVDSPAVDTSAAPVVSPEDAAIRERVIFLLSGYEYFPTRQDLDAVALAAQMAPVLQALSEERSGSPSLRSRAVDALGFYKDEVTVVHLRKLALTETEGMPRQELRAARALRYHAITSFARAAGEQALGDLEGLMAHDDVQVQLSAVSAIGKHCGARGKEVLRARQGTEQDQVMQRELRKHTGE